MSGRVLERFAADSAVAYSESQRRGRYETAPTPGARLIENHENADGNVMPNCIAGTTRGGSSGLASSETDTGR